MTQSGAVKSITALNEGLFDVLTTDEKHLIDSQVKITSHKKGEFIYKEGETPQGLMFLNSGKVKIFKEGIGGREQIVRLSKPHQFIGYRALFANEAYNGSAVALEDCSICTIDKNAITKVIEDNSKFAVKLIKLMASELGLSNTRTVTLTQKHIRGRLAESLLFLVDIYGYAGDGCTINALLSREDLANLSNMTTSNAIRTLSAFAGENVVELNGRKIKITNLKELRHISELG